MAIPILVACEMDLFRAGVRSIVEAQRNMQVVAEAADGRRAVELCRDHHPAVAIISVTLPLLNGVEVARQISEEFKTHTLLIARPDNRHLLGPAMASGALGFVLQTCTTAELLSACEAVELGQTYLGSGVTEGQGEGIPMHNIRQRAFSLLTPREREVVQLLAEGKTTKEMADVLDVSARTVESHRYQIMSKLKIRSVAELTKYALREGLTTL